MSSAKASYNDALKNLEQISEEIHKMREERRVSSDMVENYDVRKWCIHEALISPIDKRILNFRMTNASTIQPVISPMNIWTFHQS